MTKALPWAALAAMFLFLLPAGAFAKSNDASFALVNPAMIGSTQLKAGTYKVQWNGTGNQIHISILQKGKTLATASGSMVEQQRAYPYNAVDTATNSQNQNVIRGFQFANKKLELMVQRS